MKKIMASMLLVGLAGTASAQSNDLGDMSAGEITALGVVGAATLAAVVNANRSDGGRPDVVGPQDPQCEGDDEYNSDLGACVGTTTTVTVTGTGTNTYTTTVPVTFTYAAVQ